MPGDILKRLLHVSHRDIIADDINGLANEDFRFGDRFGGDEAYVLGQHDLHLYVWAS